MKYRFYHFIFSIIFFSSIGSNYACTIFITNDGKQVWVGNNEDELPSLTYRLWYYPAFKKAHGYMLWTELYADEKLNRIGYKNPQGGMNESGLFMDYTAIDEIPAIRDPRKKDREEEVVTDLLKQCKTVNEALKYLSRFNLIRLSGAQLFIADASGDYATVHGSYVIRRKTTNFALTNYSIKDGYHENCWRRDAAMQSITELKPYGLNDITNILQKTSQKEPGNLISNYSMATNLGKKTIHLYYKNDFSSPAVITLASELKKGKHHQDMQRYFPMGLKEPLLKKYQEGGITAVISTYKDLRLNFPGKYNFKNNEVLNLAEQAIARGNTADAIQLLECLSNYDPRRTDIHTWLGVAYRRDGRISESDTCFRSVLQSDPENYIATLFGKQKDQIVTFKMNDFEGAEELSLIGDFSNWKPIPMVKENGRWTCHLYIAPGAYNYKFLVNKEYLADQINLMYTGSGPKIYSKLYVW
ncbi:carcinine hydrolase/isopenicillin-N N-acyltransferase family protein [Pedobacter caeni]|nr:carcinine hydrolase/isopenicillin-N N-acyltransferase family protein [Pedobacter caeni]